MSLRISLAGQVGIVPAGEPVPVDAGGLGRLGRLAFGYLVSERGRPVPRDELADVLWDDDPPRTWDTSLRGLVSRLRAWMALAGVDGAQALTVSLGCYELHLPEGTVVDVEEATAAMDRATAALDAGDPAAARDHAEGAEAIASLTFLPGLSGPWVERRQAELHALRVEALETRADALAGLGELAASLAASEEAVALEPLRESAHLRVMTAHALAGNRGAALRAYERCRRLLAEELGVHPSPQTEAAYVRLLGDEDEARSRPPAAPPSPPAADHLAARGIPLSLSSFLGREDDCGQVAALARDHRLVTLAGTGGLGKTRLAYEVAGRMEKEFAGGAAVVELGPVPRPEGVAGAVLAALGLAEEPAIPPLDTIAAALAGRDLLLVVDNCEHVVSEAARLVDAVLRARPPGVRILATSREPLGVPGEVVWRVPTLTVPEAVRLFVERAGPARPGFEITPDDEAAVARVCARLDGIPLAVELAAARVATLSPAEIAERLDDRFRLLTAGPRTAPTRHQTLEAAVDWSHVALSPDEQVVFARLGAFASGFTLAAAEEVAAGGTIDPAAMLDLVASLVGRSLLMAGLRGPNAMAGVGGGRATRYRMLETIRVYARAKLRASGDEDTVGARLLAWAAALAEESEAQLDGPNQTDVLRTLDDDLANLHAALAVDTSSVDALRLAAALGRFWEVRGLFEEGRRWLRAVTADAPESAPAGAKARAHNAAGLLAQHQGDYAAARSRFEEALAIRRELGDQTGIAVALHGLGNVAALQHDRPAAAALYGESLEMGRELADLGLVAASLANLGWVAHAGADFAAARAYYDEALAVRQALGDHLGAAVLLGHLGDLAYQEGDYAGAETLHRQSLADRTALGDRPGRADSLSTLGHVAMQRGDAASAREAFEESLAIRRELGDHAALPAALGNLGDLALLEGDLEGARHRLEQSVAAATEARDGRAVAHALLHLGRVVLAEGDPRRAAAVYRQARDTGALNGADGLAAEWLEGAGAMLAAGGEANRAARLLGAAAALRDTIGSPVPAHEARAHEQEVAAVQQALGERAFTRAWEGGRGLLPKKAMAEAHAALARHADGPGDP